MVKLKSSICLHNLDNPELDFRVGKGFKRKPILWNSRHPLGRVRQKLHHIVHHANEDLSPPQFLGRYALSKSRCCPREGPHGQFSHTKWAEMGQKVGWYGGQAPLLHTHTHTHTHTSAIYKTTNLLRLFCVGHYEKALRMYIEKKAAINRWQHLVVRQTQRRAGQICNAEVSPIRKDV